MGKSLCIDTQINTCLFVIGRDHILNRHLLRKKSKEFKSGERGSHATGPLRHIQWPRKGLSMGVMAIRIRFLMYVEDDSSGS